MFLSTYLLRLVMLSLIGVLWHIVKTYFWRWELFLTASVLSDAPNLFFLYVTHYR